MAEDSTSSALRELRASAQKLNALGDTINAAFKSVENAIVQTGVGLPVSIDIGAYDGTSYKLGFLKVAGTWRIAIGTPELDDDGNLSTGWSPWENQPRDVKVIAVNWLPRLITALNVLASTRINEASKTVAQLDRSLTASGV
jgi:hypothetical protein